MLAFDHADRPHAGNFLGQLCPMHHVDHVIYVLVSRRLFLGQALPTAGPSARVSPAWRSLRSRPDAFFKILTNREQQLIPFFGAGATDLKIARPTSASARPRPTVIGSTSCRSCRSAGSSRSSNGRSARAFPTCAGRSRRGRTAASPARGRDDRIPGADAAGRRVPLPGLQL